MIETKLFLYVTETLFIAIGVVLLAIGVHIMTNTKHQKTKKVINNKNNKRIGKRGYWLCGIITLVLSVWFAGIAVGAAENIVIGYVFIIISATLLLFSLILLGTIYFKIGEKRVLQ